MLRSERSRTSRAQASAVGRSNRRDHGHGAGQALVELALILPILLVLCTAALDLGRLYYSQITINNAAKEGALEAAGEPTIVFTSGQPCDKDTNTVMCPVLNSAKDSLISIAPADVALTCSPSPCPTSATATIGNTVTVTVTGHFSLVSPTLAVFFGGQSFDLHAASTAQVGVQPRPAGFATPTPAATPTPTPSPTPSPAPTPSPDATPTPTPTPVVCVTPTVSGDISVNFNSGKSVAWKGEAFATTFNMDAPTVAPQIGCTFSYTWLFGDGASATTQNASHVYQTAGTSSNNEWTITLVISAGTGATWVGTTTVRVNP
jgi:Flp pilus assembly protein TadG